MATVYLLWHTNRHVDAEYGDEKLIGVYSDRVKAEAAIGRLKTKPGFKQSPENFEICEYTIDEDNWTEGFGVQTGAE